MKAEADGRLADADKLLTAAIRDAELNSPLSRRMGWLLGRLAGLRLRQGRIADAVSTERRALLVDQKVFGPASERVVADYSNLAMMLSETGENDAAEQAYRRGLAIARLSSGPRSVTLLMLLNNLAANYVQADREAEAEALIEEGLAICHPEQPGPESCAHFRGLLASHLRRTGRESAAEGIVADAIAAEHDSSPAWYSMVRDLETLARQYEQDESYDLAEQAYRQAIEIIERKNKPDGPFRPIAQLYALGEVLRKEGRDSEAEDSFKRAWAITVKNADPEHPQQVQSFPAFHLMNLYRDEGRLREMEPILREWLALQERILGSNNLSLAATLLEMAEVCQEEQRYADAQPLVKRALQIQETSLGLDDARLIPTLRQYADVLRAQGQADEAGKATARAEAISRRLSPQDNP